MKYLSFTIENYKGIEKETVDLSGSQANIFTMVGINESGKTTFLDAVEVLDKKVSNEKIHTFIPKSKKHIFTGEIVVATTLLLDEADKQKVSKFFAEKRLVVEHIPDTLVLKRTFTFTKAKLLKKRFVIESDLVLKTKTKEPKTYKLYENDRKKELQDEFCEFVRENKPPIVYYRNFLFDFPTKIYLESHPKEGTEQSFYRDVIQDILDSLSSGDENLEISDLIERIADSDSKQSREALNATTKKMGAKIADEISKTWDKLFQGGRNKKSISIEPDTDVIEDATSGDVTEYPYLTFSIEEGSESYEIAERSLGFRWFFVFLLFTTFRKNRASDEGEILFLLDEPASNLHSTAQSELLGVLQRLGADSKLIYTTHSHHLVNPEWLENTFIVKNIAITPKKELDFDAAQTDIKVEPYKVFVGHSANQQEYFQPVLDSIEYKPSELENTKPLVIFEGKNDFYSFKWVGKQLSWKNIENIGLYPGGGAGKNEKIIGLYIAWGVDFLVLMDGDSAGTEAHKKYVERFGIAVDKHLVTLGSINKDFVGFATEKLFTESDQLSLVQDHKPSLKKVTKKNLNESIQFALMTESKLKLETDTKKNFRKVFSYIDKHFKV